jgi:hypothetical protein
MKDCQTERDGNWESSLLEVATENTLEDGLWTKNTEIAKFLWIDNAGKNAALTNKLEREEISINIEFTSSKTS